MAAATAITKVNPGKAVNTGIIIVVSLVGTFALVFLIIKGSSIVKSLFQAGKDELDSADINVSQLSYTTAQYKSFADQLYEALDGIDWNHSQMVATVNGIFAKMKTYDDVRQLVVAYSTRSVGNFNVFGWEADSRDLNLPQSLSWALERKEIEKINSDLAANNINYSF